MTVGIVSREEQPALNVSWETGTKTTCTRVPGDSQPAAQVSHLPKRPITVSETLYRVEDSSQCWRHCTVSETLRFFAQSGPASRPTSQRLDPSTVSRRHTTMSETSRVRTPNDVTSNPIRIWPSGSRPIFGSLVSRGRLAFFCFLCGGGCRPFGVSVARVALLGAFPAAFSSFWRFPVSPRLLSGSSFLCRK